MNSEAASGFRDTYNRILSEREDIRSCIQGMNSASLRHILRSTALYGELIKRTLEPSRLREGEERTRAERIFLEIEKDALKTPGGHLCWFGPDYYMKTGMELLGPGLYSAICEFMLEAGTVLDDDRLIKAARARMALVMKRAERYGGYINVSKGISPVFSPGLFYGNAGIGYEMLRLAAPDRIESLLI